jgi:hypothetical protein
MTWLSSSNGRTPSKHETTKMARALNTIYEKSQGGFGVLSPIEEVASSYLDEDTGDAVKKLIRNHVALAGTAGFVTSVGGVATLPVSLPANLTSTLAIQLRMVSGIAIATGHDPADDRVKALGLACLVGSSYRQALRKAGIELGKKAALQAVGQVPGKVLIQINKQVGFRLLTKFGKTGVVNLGKLTPVVGGLVGGGVDSVSTYAVGKAARTAFSG